ncbi:VWA domain-containing protein [Synechococcus sp. BIOS-E4-1]|uniref:VWA domain-containing protein n=1 Tax=Synechococcus sp. BIOS-E4-1 TaxID=1400864 RepID=UPI0021053164|nr:VWA domain-containing protein [Synechococcus sp. BIOS-E4-1]
MALRSTQTLISEGQGKATLRQNTTNGLRLMRSEVERSMNLLVTRTDTTEGDDPEMDLMSNHADVVMLCKNNAGSQGFKPIFGINMVELEEPVIYGVSLSSNQRGYSILRCGAALNMDGTYQGSKSGTSEATTSDETFESQLFISRVIDDIGTIPCRLDDLAEDEGCPAGQPLADVLEQSEFTFTQGKTPARTFQQPAIRVQTDINTKLVKFIDPYTLDDSNTEDPYQISASYLEKTSDVKSSTKKDLHFAAFARADKRVRYGFNDTNGNQGDGYSGGAFFQNITSRNVRFILDGSGSMSACVAWSGEYSNSWRLFYDPNKGWFYTREICSFTRMEALQHEMIDIIKNLPDATKMGLAAFSTEDNDNNKTWAPSEENLVELGPPTSETRQSAIDFVLSLSAGNPGSWGGTMPWDSLDQAFGDSVTDTVYFLSDGKPNRDQDSNDWTNSDYDIVANYYAGLNASRVTNGNRSIKINSTSVGLDSPWMQLLSSKTSGEYIKVDDI